MQIVPDLEGDSLPWYHKIWYKPIYWIVCGVLLLVITFLEWKNKRRG